jgi:hypothetical protein
MQLILRAFYFLALFLFPKNGNEKSAVKNSVFSVAATIFIQFIEFTALCFKTTFSKTGKKEFLVLFKVGHTKRMSEGRRFWSFFLGFF